MEGPDDQSGAQRTDGWSTVEAIGSYRSLHDLVLQRLRDAILDGRLEPGKRLKVRDLAAMLDVSPMPVQEALHVLEIEGLAVRTPRRGVVVSTLSPEDVRHAYDLLAALDGLAAAEAARRLTAEDVAALRVCVEKIGELLEAVRRAGAVHEREHAALLDENRALHRRIATAYPSGRANEFLRQLWNYTYRIRRVYRQSWERLEQAQREHHALLAALEAGDAEAAERISREHTRHAGADLVRQIAAHATPHHGD